MKFIDYYNFKEDDCLKRHTVILSVCKPIHSILKKNGTSKSFQYLMLNYFTKDMLKKAVAYYAARDFEIESGDYEHVTVSGAFDQATYSKFYDVVHDCQLGVRANKINYAAKLVLYYLFDANIIGAKTTTSNSGDSSKRKQATSSTTSKKKKRNTTKHSSSKTKSSTEINISVKIINKTEEN